MKRLLSASTTTGTLTIGNYIGAIKNWQEMQDSYDCFYMVADLHALTVKQDPKLLNERRISFFAQYLALGLDPEKNTVFMQSDVSEHAELAWVLTCLTPMGHLNRMTQFKEKAAQHSKNINAGLFSYPVLMAADILLYQTDIVPVGEDQKQHLELCRDIVGMFQHHYKSGVLKLPSPYVAKTGNRIMSLQDPDKKMSKSDPNPKAYVSILDPEKVILKKIKSAVTDSGSSIIFNPEVNPGISNLIEIMSAFSHKSISEIETAYDGKMYGHLKIDLAEIIAEALSPVQKRYDELMGDKAELNRIIAHGAQKAKEEARKTMDQVYRTVGLR